MNDALAYGLWLVANVAVVITTAGAARFKWGRYCQARALGNNPPAHFKASHKALIKRNADHALLTTILYSSVTVLGAIMCGAASYSYSQGWAVPSYVPLGTLGFAAVWGVALAETLIDSRSIERVSRLLLEEEG